MVQGGHSVLWFDFSIFEEIRFLKNRNRSVLRKFRNRAFRFGLVSVLTELTETLGEGKITRKTYMFYSKFRQYFLYFIENSN